MEARPDVERRSEAGFSVIEGLIAAALLLIVTVGVLPLFSRSMLNNIKGNESSRLATGATDEFERTTSLPFNSADMRPPAGATTRIDNEVIALRQLGASSGGPQIGVSWRWEDPATLGSGDIPQQLRRRTLQQFAFSDFVAVDPDASFLDPLPDGTEERLIHYKVIDVSFFDLVRDPLAEQEPTYDLRLIEAF